MLNEQSDFQVLPGSGAVFEDTPRGKAAGGAPGLSASVPRTAKLSGQEVAAEKAPDHAIKVSALLSDEDRAHPLLAGSTPESHSRDLVDLLQGTPGLVFLSGSDAG
jgi:hypothetical protein